MSYRLGLELATYRQLYESGVDIRQWNPSLGPLPFTPGRLLKPIQFPPAESGIERMVLDGPSWPDALSTCPDYSLPVGQPIILELGRGPEPFGRIVPSSHSITDGDSEISHCLIDASTYRNENEDQADWGANLLFKLGAVVLLPRHPLEAGHHYSVSIDIGSAQYSWTFATAPAAR